MDSKDKQWTPEKEREEKVSKERKRNPKQTGLGKELTSNNLRIVKEQWIYKLIYKKVKLEKCIEKRKRKQDNFKSHRDQTGIFKPLEGDQTQEVKMLDVEKFVKIWGHIRKKNKRTPNIRWMKEVKRLLGKKVTIISEFDRKAKEEIKERKIWTAPRIGGVQKSSWKKLRVAQKALMSALKRIYSDKIMITGCCSD